MADKKHTRETIKEKVKRLKRKIKHKKIVGDPKITGITRPKKKKVHAGKDGKRDGSDKPVVVGPRGGQYKEGPGGKKQYKKRADEARKSMVLDLIEQVGNESKVLDFVDKFKKGKK